MRWGKLIEFFGETDPRLDVADPAEMDTHLIELGLIEMAEQGVHERDQAQRRVKWWHDSSKPADEAWRAIVTFDIYDEE